MRGIGAGEFPLVGREAELDRIVRVMDGAGPRAFVLAGPAGVGKTRLAAEAAKVAARSGHATAHVIATRSAASIPFGPFAAFLPDSDDLRAGLLGLLCQASEAITARAGPHRRLMLVVDDAHLLDDGSAALVHQIVREGSCSVLASVRTPGPTPDPITGLWKEGLAERIDLGILSEPEVAEFAARVLGGPVAGGSVHRLWEASGGNALCVRELIVGAVGSGALADDGGVWRLHRPLVASDRLAELVATRLEGLAPGTVAVVELLAAGEPLDLALLEAMTANAALEDAERQGLVEVSQDGERWQARLAHPVYGEVLRQRLPRSRLRRLWTMLADAVQETGARRREDLLRVGRWRLDAGAGGDPALLTRAARRSHQMFDMDLAARLARAALSSGGGVEAGLVLGEAEFSSGHHEQAEAVLAGLVPLCSTDAELALVANARSYNFSNLMGDMAAAATVLEEALSAVTDPAARLRLNGRMAVNRLFAAELDAARAAVAEALDSDDLEVAARGTYISSIAWALSGRTQQAVSVARRGLDLHRRWRSSEAFQLPEVQLIGAVLGHAAGGCLSQAETDAATGYQACVEAGDKEGQATFSLLRGWTWTGQGRLNSASLGFREGASINRELHDICALRWCLGGLALAEGMAGHPAAASAALAELDEIPSVSPTMFDADLIDRGRAWACVAAGQESRARAALDQAAQRAAASGLWVAEAHLRHDIARLGAPALTAERLAELADTTDGSLIGLLADHAAALARACAPDLDHAAEGFEAAGAWLLAAEARTAAAVGYRAEGLLRLASAAARKAAELTTMCGDVRTPGLSGGLETQRLTRREREVAALAAAGASSRQIAADLCVSSRTVDNHLQKIYAKLGVTSRDELAVALTRSSFARS
ncbi:MAG TPA: LuxR C-terminal-related transcriptional regulator [Streptosporangiaceae bacterium]